MNVLALSTSSPRGSVAIVSGDRVVAEAAHEDPRGHAEHLFSLVDEVLARASLGRADLGLVACDVGPGSFTGVRIAVASAKGIAVGLGLPLAGVVSLEAMAMDALASLDPGARPALVAAAIDAKKDELYVAVYEVAPAPSAASGTPSPQRVPAMVSVIERLAPAHVPIAEAARRVAEVIGERPFVSIADVPAFEGFAREDGLAPPVRTLVAPPKAAWIGRLAAARYATAEGPDASEIVPLYVRAPDAVPSPSGAPGALAMLPAR